MRKIILVCMSVIFFYMFYISTAYAISYPYPNPSDNADICHIKAYAPVGHVLQIYNLGGSLGDPYSCEVNPGFLGCAITLSGLGPGAGYNILDVQDQEWSGMFALIPGFYQCGDGNDPPMPGGGLQEHTWRITGPGGLDETLTDPGLDGSPPIPFDDPNFFSCSEGEGYNAYTLTYNTTDNMAGGYGLINNKDPGLDWTTTPSDLRTQAVRFSVYYDTSQRECMCKNDAFNSGSINNCAGSSITNVTGSNSCWTGSTCCGDDSSEVCYSNLYGCQNNILQTNMCDGRHIITNCNSHNDDDVSEFNDQVKVCANSGPGCTLAQALYLDAQAIDADNKQTAGAATAYDMICMSSYWQDCDHNSPICEGSIFCGYGDSAFIPGGDINLIKNGNFSPKKDYHMPQESEWWFEDWGSNANHQYSYPGYGEDFQVSVTGDSRTYYDFYHYPGVDTDKYPYLIVDYSILSVNGGAVLYIDANRGSGQNLNDIPLDSSIGRHTYVKKVQGDWQGTDDCQTPSGSCSSYNMTRLGFFIRATAGQSMVVRIRGIKLLANGAPDGWKPYGDTNQLSHHIEYTADNPNSLKMKTTSNTASWEGIHGLNSSKVSPTTTYTLSALIKAEGIVGSAALSLHARSDPPDGDNFHRTVLSSDASITNTGGVWVRKYVTLQTWSDTDVIIPMVYFNPSSRGTIWVKEMQLEKGDTITTYTEVAGEYEPGPYTDPSSKECCGDDPNEYIVSKNGYNVCCSTPAAQVACVADGRCVLNSATNTDGDSMPDQCDSCPTDPDVTTGNCIPKLGGLITFDDNANSKIELSATTWAPDAGATSLIETSDSYTFEASGGTLHNMGTWVRKEINPTQPISDYKYIKFAYKIPNTETACLLFRSTQTAWKEIADTSTTCSSYGHSTYYEPLINDGKWHVASVDISDFAGYAWWLLSGGTGHIYLDNVYLTKETTTYSKPTDTASDSPGTKLTVYSVCNDDDGASQIEANNNYLANLINYQDSPGGNPNRGYYYHTTSGGVLESTATQYGILFTELLTSESSSWSKGDSRIMKAVLRTEGYNSEYGVYSNDISLRCNDAATYNSWDHNSVWQTVPANTGIDNNYDTNYKSFDCPYSWATADDYCSDTSGIHMCKADNSCGAAVKNDPCTDTADCELGLYCSFGFKGLYATGHCCSEGMETYNAGLSACSSGEVVPAPPQCETPDSWKTNPDQCRRYDPAPYEEIVCQNNNIEPTGNYYWCPWITIYGTQQQ